MYCERTGCDSVVQLTLSVNPKLYAQAIDSIFDGDVYEFGSQKLTEAGPYTEVFTSAVTGCDSIVELALRVKPALRDSTKAEICDGSVYNWSQEEYTVSGTYRKELKNELGQDSISILVLTVNPIVDVDLDTIRILYSELPYTNADYPQISLDASTALGDYSGVVETEDCRKVSYVLSVVSSISTGADNLRSKELSLVPSMIAQSEKTVAVYDFTEQDKVAGVLVELFDMTGRKVRSEKVSGNRVEIGGFSTSGVYTVRITTEDGQKTGRVVVK